MMLNDPHPCIVISSDCEKSLSFEALRDSRFSHMCRAPLCIPHLSFIPLEPYPARYARHLPHAGKALSVVILFSHMRVFVLTLWGKRYSRIVAFPLEGKAFDAGGERYSQFVIFIIRGSWTHAFPICALHFSAFLICLSCR